MNSSCQFSYFSDSSNGYINGAVIDIYKGASALGQGGANVAYGDLSAQLGSLGVQAGDIMYSYKNDGAIHHAVVVSKADESGIYYAANSLIRYDHDLSDALNNEDGVLIVRMNDASS